MAWLGVALVNGWRATLAAVGLWLLTRPRWRAFKEHLHIGNATPLATGPQTTHTVVALTTLCSLALLEFAHLARCGNSQ